MGRADIRRAQQRDAFRGPGRDSFRRPGRDSFRRPRRGPFRHLTWRRLLGSALTATLLGMLAFIGLYVYVDVPASGNVQATAQSNTYKYADGSVMVRTGKVNRESVDLSEIPKGVQHAAVAAENKSFYRDAGVDLKGTARGVVNTLLGQGTQGGSTITQQFVKNYYLSQEQTVSRKLQEIVMSLKVDKQFDKNEILAGYLNTSYYGRGAYGIQAAAQAYYRVDAEQLTTAQGAYLTSLLQAPSQFDWATANAAGKKRVQARWNYTLDNMVDMGWLDANKRAGLKFPVPQKPRPAPGLEGQNGYLVKAAEAELTKQGVSEQELAAGGWTIKLGIDKNRQRDLEQAVKDRLTSRLDPKTRKTDADTQAGAVSVDPTTGRVVAMYGGKGYTEHYVNNATRTDYQPASTFKPLILASALENGATTQDGQPITPNTVYDGTSERPIEGSHFSFAPPNEDDKNYGKVTVQKAMNHSVNSVFAQMGVDAGLDAVQRTATDLGMDRESMSGRPAMTLGTMGASPLTMAGVYATLDNHGEKITPSLVTAAERGPDEQIDLPDPVGDQAVSRQTADTVTSVLTGVVQNGTGSAVRATGSQVAGKTGTSDDNKSAWFVGYTPKLVTAVGLFGEDADAPHGQVTLSGAGGGGRVNGGGYPAEIWGAYTQAAIAGQTPAGFDLDVPRFAPPATRTPSPSDPPTGTPTPSETAPTHTPGRPKGPKPKDPITPTPTYTWPTDGSTDATEGSTAPSTDGPGNDKKGNDGDWDLGFQ